ncbi:MAG TPA: heme o synthase [Candidatus Thermoplasmatota archaeon]|nr:heme o synthase [Candidatus Thermoplasmatota archaeon]
MEPRLLRFRRLALLTAGIALGQIVLGGYTASTGSGLGCGEDWPHCNGAIVPGLSVTTEVIEYAHRVWAVVLGLAGLVLLSEAIRLRHRTPEAAKAVFLAAGLFAFQAVLGGLVVMTTLRPELVALHAGFASLLFVSIAAAWLLAREPKPAPASPAVGAAAAPSPWAIAVKDYLLLLKPGILFLLVLTGITTMLVAGGLSVTLPQIGWTLLGGALSAASANVLNGYLERDLDATMVRTRNRPLPAGRVPPSHALALSVLFGVASVGVFVAFVNPLSALLAVGGIFFYVVVYTSWLKQRTPQNIVIGGAAGCFPALVGWAAVTNEIAAPALLLGLLVFLWTPPHFWALALIYKQDYASARVPMMPVVRGEGTTKRQMFLYSVLLVAATLLFYWPLGTLGWFYLGLAVALGAPFVWLAWRVLREPGLAASRSLFRYSVWYLALLFAGMVLDKVAFASPA